MRAIVDCRVVVVGVLAIAGNAVSFDYQPLTIGPPPTGWHCGATGKRHAEVDDRGYDASVAHPVLKQSGRAPFPWCVKDDIALAGDKLGSACAFARCPDAKTRRAAS